MPAERWPRDQYEAFIRAQIAAQGEDFALLVTRFGFGIEPCDCDCEECHGWQFKWQGDRSKLFGLDRSHVS